MPLTLASTSYWIETRNDNKTHCTMHGARQVVPRCCAPCDSPVMSGMGQWLKREGLWSNIEADFSTDVTAHVREAFCAQVGTEVMV